MKTKLCLALLLALVAEQVSSQRLLGLMASAGLMRALRNREQQQKESPSPLNQHQPEPVPGGYPGSPPHGPVGFRPAGGFSEYGYGGYGGGSAGSSLEGASPFGAASYGYPTFSQFGSNSFGGYPGNSVGFAPSSAFQGYGGSSVGAEHVASASQQSYQTAPAGSYGQSSYASPSVGYGKGYSGQGQSFQ
ncbi:prisilkin-39-like [Varroa jacobsoni]|uniref:Uncharacterized protein n=1 Tax=Varroa destructor TaxID=109461 RepID=A0A7M7JXW7_VARDE|nr:prisilkin-39-like [Varroa destructor]XP_022708996.1 prisilkin-39-like [Varroa jacobsoni]